MGIEKGSNLTFQQLLCIYIALRVEIFGIALYCWVVLAKIMIVIPETKPETKQTNNVKAYTSGQADEISKSNSNDEIQKLDEMDARAHS